MKYEPHALNVERCEDNGPLTDEEWEEFDAELWFLFKKYKINHLSASTEDHTKENRPIKQKLFEETLTEPKEEQGRVLSLHIHDILEPFIEMGEVEWATEMICIACDVAMEPFRGHFHSKECRDMLESAKENKGHWECICEVNGEKGIE